MNKDTSWGKVADWYDGLLEDSKDSYQAKVILPNLLRIIDPDKGMDILDVACGQGYFARAFHEKGANITGCDIGVELIDLARKHSSNEIKYFVSDVENFSLAFEKNSKNKFDIITIILAIQNIAQIDKVFEQCAHILKPKGRLIIVLNHPAFRIFDRSSWQWDEISKSQYRRIDAYMSEFNKKVIMNPGEKNDSNRIDTISFHRPLQVYFKSLSKSGFAVIRFEEWISHKKSQNGPRSKEEDRIRKEVPMFICIECKVVN